MANFMQLVKTLEDRQRAYNLEVIDTYFSAEQFVDLLVALLNTKSCRACELRGCESSVSKWMRLEAVALLSWHLHGGQPSRMYHDDAAPYDVSRTLNSLQGDPPNRVERNHFWDRLRSGWLVPAKVRSSVQLACFFEVCFQCLCLCERCCDVLRAWRPHT